MIRHSIIHIFYFYDINSFRFIVKFNSLFHFTSKNYNTFMNRTYFYYVQNVNADHLLLLSFLLKRKPGESRQLYSCFGYYLGLIISTWRVRQENVILCNFQFPNPKDIMWRILAFGSWEEEGSDSFIKYLFIYLLIYTVSNT